MEKLKIKQLVYLIALLSLSFLFSGCGFVGLSQKENINAENWETFDPNDYNININTAKDGTKKYTWKIDDKLSESYITIDYWNAKRSAREYPVVKGKLNGKIYPMIFDTGCTFPVFIQDLHVNDNNLPVFFFDSKKPKSGLAVAKNIESGSFVIQNHLCAFFGQSPRWTFLGIPFAREKHFFIGLPFIRAFKHCRFDQISNQIHLSVDKSFEPENEDAWIKYPFEIKNKCLKLDIPIEGVETNLMLDTGACTTIDLNKSIIEKLFKKRTDIEKARKFKSTSINPHMNRTIKTLRFHAENLKFGEYVLGKTKLYSSLTEHEGYDGIIGMELFEKTEMVLDFDKNLMWVKRCEGSVFE